MIDRKDFAQLVADLRAKGGGGVGAPRGSVVTALDGVRFERTHCN